MPVTKTADTTAPVDQLLARRWSPRGFDRHHELGDEALASLLEAARWAPSANNSQPWRFLVTRRGEPAHDRLSGVLAPGNQGWAPAASALVLVAARSHDDEGRELPWAVYDTGQAVACLTVQAQSDGLAVHQMGGFDADAAKVAFDLPDGLRPVVVVAVGRHDADAVLSDSLAERELAPRSRAPLGSLLLDADARPSADRDDAA